MSDQADDILVLDHLSGVEFHGNHVAVYGSRIQYDDVNHLEFIATATKHSVNGIPMGTSYSTTLALHQENGQVSRIFMEKPAFKKKKAFEAILRAAAIIGGITFNSRVERYEKLMEERGFVEWGAYQINRKGNLFRNNVLCFNLLADEASCKLDRFHVDCGKSEKGIGGFFKNVFSGGERIDLSIDRDCFIYIVKHYLGLSWPSETIPEKRVDGRKLFREALLTLGAKLCKTDGRISKEEILVFKRYFSIDENSVPSSGKIFNEAARDPRGPQETAKQLYGIFGGDKEVLEYILFGLMQVAAADGYIHPKERAFIRTVASAFTFNELEIDGLFALFTEASGRSGADSSDDKRSTNDPYLHHLHVLGLQAGVSFEDIKVRYREMARCHHPDILRAKGIPIDDIRDSEEILKAINTSYEWLTEYHSEPANSR